MPYMAGFTYTCRILSEQPSFLPPLDCNCLPAPTCPPASHHSTCLSSPNLSTCLPPACLPYPARPLQEHAAALRVLEEQLGRERARHASLEQRSLQAQQQAAEYQRLAAALQEQLGTCAARLQQARLQLEAVSRDKAGLEKELLQLRCGRAARGWDGLRWVGKPWRDVSLPYMSVCVVVCRTCPMTHHLTQLMRDMYTASDCMCVPPCRHHTLPMPRANMAPRPDPHK